MTGIIKTIDATNITIETDNGAGLITQSIKADATITLDGNKVTLGDLRAGDMVVLIGDPVTKIAAS